METDRLTSGNGYRPDFARPSTVDHGQVPNGHAYTVAQWTDGRDAVVQEYWRVTGMNHAWSGGSVFGSFTDPQGPDATNAMWTFFSRHRNHPADGGHVGQARTGEAGASRT